MAKYKQEPWGGVTIYDPAAWKREQTFVVDENGVVVCNICRQVPAFFGWCSGAATFSCRCGVDQETLEKNLG